MDRDKLEQIIMEELHNEGWRDNLGKATGAFKVAADKFKQFNLKQMGDFGEKVGNIGGRYVTRDPDKKNPRSWTRGQKRDAIIDFKLGVACRTTRAISEDFGEEVNALIDEYFPIKKYGPTGQVCPKKKKKGGAAVNEKVGKTSVDRAGKNLSQKLQGMVDNYEDSDSGAGGKKTWKNAYQAFDREMRENGMLYMLDSKTRIQFGKEMYQLWQQYGGMRTAAEDEQSARKGQEVRDQLRASLADQGLTPEQAEEVINAAIDQLKASDVPISEQFIAKFKTRLIERLSENTEQAAEEAEAPAEEPAAEEASDVDTEKALDDLNAKLKGRDLDSDAGLKAAANDDDQAYLGAYMFYKSLLKLKSTLAKKPDTPIDQLVSILKEDIEVFEALLEGGKSQTQRQRMKRMNVKKRKHGQRKAGQAKHRKQVDQAKKASAAAEPTSPAAWVDKQIARFEKLGFSFESGMGKQTDSTKKAIAIAKKRRGVKDPKDKEQTGESDITPEKGKLKISAINQKLAAAGVDQEVRKKAMDALKKDLAPLLKQYNVKLSEQQKKIFKSKLREEIIRRELIK